MDLTIIFVRRSKTLVVTLLFMASVVFGQDAPMVSPPLTMKPGTVLTVRINEPLSSDHSRVGDVFSATLTQPVIVLGIVVARYGQTVAGQVVEAKKAGRVSGVSRLGLTLTSLTLVDGLTVPIQSQLLVREGPTSVGRDAAARRSVEIRVSVSIGAAAGAAAGTIGVLLTRGLPTVHDTCRRPCRHDRERTWERTHTRSVVGLTTEMTRDCSHVVSCADGRAEPRWYPPEQTQQPQQTLDYPAPPSYPYPYFVYPPSYCIKLVGE
jgi:hypothetical protein